MSQFCVHQNLNLLTKDRYPFILDIQSPLLDSLETRLVIPLMTQTIFSAKPITNLMPLTTIKNKSYVVLTSQMAAINKKQLGNMIQDLSNKRNEIISAIDFLITGF